MSHRVVRESEQEYVRVDWGRSKKLINPESAGSKFLRLSITEYAPGTEHTLHRHPGQEEVIFVLDGEGISRTKEGDLPLRPGSAAFVPADTDHATINLSKDRPMRAIICKSPPEEGKG
jgi:quercetin dioxygenase-like cupin family protein